MAKIAKTVIALSGGQRLLLSSVRSLACAMLIPQLASAQSAAATAKPKQQPVVPPAVIRLCDPQVECGTLTWNNGHYDAVWSRATATMLVQSFSPASVVLRRVDRGARAGFVYIYKGTISPAGDSILDGVWVGEARSRQAGAAGHFTATWQAPLQASQSAPTSSIPNADPVPAGSTRANGALPPAVIRICDPQVECGTLIWNNGHYDAVWSGGTATMTVQSFSADSVVLRRVDQGSRAGFVYVYKGTISPAGDTILDGVWVGEAGSRQAGATGRFTASWQAPFQASQAVRTNPTPNTTTVPAGVPPSNQAVSIGDAENEKNFGEDGCPIAEPAGNSLSAFEMFKKGKEIQAYTSEQTTDLEALQWFCKAANGGSGQAAFEIGELYYNGFAMPSIHRNGVIYSNGMRPNLAMAFRWYKTAAAAKNTQGMVRAANFYQWGTKIAVSIGSHVENNNEPIDVRRAFDLIKEAADLGDTDAMNRLREIYMNGVEDSQHRIAPNADEAASWTGRLVMQKADIWRKCEKEQIYMQELTPDRMIERVFPGDASDHGYFCVARYKPQESSGSTLEDILAAAQGQMMSTWRYTIYFTPDRSLEWLVRASVREEVLRSATDLGIIAAATKSR